MIKKSWDGLPPDYNQSCYHYLHRKGWLNLSVVFWNHHLQLWEVDMNTNLDAKSASMIFDYVEPVSWAIVYEIKNNQKVIV